MTTDTDVATFMQLAHSSGRLWGAAAAGWTDDPESVLERTIEALRDGATGGFMDATLLRTEETTE